MTDAVIADGFATRRASVATQVAEHLERLVRSGALPSRTRLPSERALSETLGVSRASVREAVRELWLKGLVDRRQGSGTFVTASVDSTTGFAAQVHDRLGQDALALINVIDYRAAVEPAIAARAAERASASDLERLSGLLSALEAAESLEDSVALDAALHRAIANATRNPILVAVLDFTASWLSATRQAALHGPRRRAQSNVSHRLVVEAIQARDPAAAAAAMTRHVREVASFVAPRLPVGSDSGLLVSPALTNGAESSAMERSAAKPSDVSVA